MEENLVPNAPDSRLSQAQAIARRSLSQRSHTVWVGFGLLLLLLTAGSLYAYIASRNLQAATVRARTEYRRRDQALDQLVSDIFYSSTLARDYLLEEDEARADANRQQLEAVRARMFATREAYDAMVRPTDAPSLAALRADIDGFWNVMEPALHWSPDIRMKEADAYLAKVLLPKGTAVEKLAREIATRDERELDKLDRVLESRYMDFQRQMFLGFVLLLSAGLIAALLSTRRISRLEREAEVRYEQVAEARLQLRELSGQLVNAQEDERRKLSRELHDQLGQSMSALVTELSRLEHDTGSSELVKERAAVARQIAEDSVRSIRDTALLLRPSMLDDLGLVPALNWQAREVRRRSGLKVRMATDEISEDLPDAYKTCIYRVVQEALHNCVKHANATEARVVLRQTPEGLSISVQDDGVGFDAAHNRGMGLLGMEERVSRLNGLFRVESKPGHGTVLSALFPDVDTNRMEAQTAS
jgi:signal transduction histidine kinase